MLKKYLKFIWNMARKPSMFLAYFISIFRGCFYIVWYKATRRNVTIRFPFLCHEKVKICGPGKVFIDSHCQVWMNTFEHLVIMTLSPKADVRIGRNCTLGGLTIRCREKVEIGDNVLTAANLIQDVPIVNAPKSLLKNGAGDPAEIIVGKNVWLGGQSLIIGGSCIGNGSVLGVNALLYNSFVANDCLSSGNPAMRPIPIAKLNKWDQKDKL